MPVGSCQLLGRRLLRLVLLGRSICPTADMLMRVNEIKQSQRELLIGIGGGECTAAAKGECQDGGGGGVLERASVKHSIWQTTRTYQHNTHNMCTSVSRDMRGIAHSMLVSSHSFLCPHTHTHTHIKMLPLCVDKLLTASAAAASASTSTSNKLILGIFCRILICFYIYIP